MKKAEFIKLWCELVAAGRKRIHPDIRPSEAAMAMFDDREFAAKFWRRGARVTFAGMTVDEGRVALSKQKEENRPA